MNRTYLAIAGAVVVGIGAVIYVQLLPDKKETTDTTAGEEQSVTGYWEPLRSNTSLPTCQSVVESLNSTLARNPKALDVRMSEKEQTELQAKAELGKVHLEEVLSERFTRLDAHYLDLCFLLRDAARALVVNLSSSSEKAETEQEQLTRATLAFQWVLRQVAIQPTDVDPKNPKLTPENAVLIAPELVLRVGQGSPVDPVMAPGMFPPQLLQRIRAAAPLQRANLFLLMLHQLGIDGCLIGSSTGNEAQYWACGAVIGKEIYLFDPRLGMPLPGPGGKSVLTLKQLRADPKVLDVLKTGEKDQEPYDVTAENVKNTRVFAFAPESALSKRMRALEQALNKHAIYVRLALDLPAQMERIQKAWSESGEPSPQVKMAQWSLLLQAGFYPKSDGGLGDEGVVQAFRSMVSPTWILGQEVPREFFGTRGTVGDPVNESLLGRFREQFESLHLKPNEPRDSVLRGRYATADRALGKLSADLSGYQRQFEVLYRQKNSAQMRKGLVTWGVKARAAIANGSSPEFPPAIATFFDGVAAEELLARVGYLTGLSHQEKAARMLFEWENSPEKQTREQRQDLLEDVLKEWRSARFTWAAYPWDDNSRYLSSCAGWQLARCEQVMSKLFQAKADQQTNADQKAVWQEKANDARAHSRQIWKELAARYRGLLRLHCQYQAHSLRSSE